MSDQYINPQEVIGSLGLFVLPVIFVIFLIYLKRKQIL
jgi:hypothetical protein